MRKTLHLIDAEDARWLLPLYEPGIEAWSRRRAGQLGMSAADLEKALGVIEGELARGEPLARSAIVTLLARRGIDLGPQTRTHLFVTAVTSGVAAFGPDVERREPALVARESWLGKAPRFDRPPALAELARRYFGAFGPATERDFAGWAGLALRDVRAGMSAVAAELREVRVDGAAAWEPRRERRRARRVVRLLPGWDNYLMGWRDRSFIAPAELWDEIGIGGGFLKPCVLVDGVAVGVWGVRRAAGRARFDVDYFSEVGPADRAAVDDELADVARFEGLRTGG